MSHNPNLQKWKMNMWNWLKKKRRKMKRKEE